MHLKYLNLKDFCEFHWAFVLQHLSTLPFSFGIPHLPLFQVVTASEDHIVIPSRVTRLMDVGDRTRRSSADLKRLWACYQLVSVCQTSVVVNQRVSDVMMYCHAFFNHSKCHIISIPKFHNMLSSQMFLLKLGSSLWLEETNHRKTQETQPHSQSAHDKRVVSVKKVSLTWLFETSGNLTRLWCTSLLGLIQISDPHSTWIDHLSFEVASNIFCYRCCYRYLASRKSSQRSPFLLSTATQVTSSMVMEDSAMFVAKITWTQCNECSTQTKGPVGYTFT